MEITYKDQQYKFVEQKDDCIIFKLKSEEKFKDKTLEQLLINYKYTQEDVQEIEQEYADYDDRVEEFRYCGYTEEDYNFHAMCGHLNSIEERLRKTENERDELYNEIDRRFNDMTDDEIDELLCEYDVEL